MGIRNVLDHTGRGPIGRPMLLVAGTMPAAHVKVLPHGRDHARLQALGAAVLLAKVAIAISFASHRPEQRLSSAFLGALVRFIVARGHHRGRMWNGNGRWRRSRGRWWWWRRR